MNKKKIKELYILLMNIKLLYIQILKWIKL